MQSASSYNLLVEKLQQFTLQGTKRISASDEKPRDCFLNLKLKLPALNDQGLCANINHFLKMTLVSLQKDIYSKTKLDIIFLKLVLKPDPYEFPPSRPNLCITQ